MATVKVSAPAAAAPGRAVQVGPIKPTLKAPGTERLKRKRDKNCFQILPSNSSCADTTRRRAAASAQCVQALMAVEFRV
jgi:hypothetical protein